MTNGALYCRMIHADTQRKYRNRLLTGRKAQMLAVNRGKSDNHLPYQADFHKLCQSAEPMCCQHFLKRSHDFISFLKKSYKNINIQKRSESCHDVNFSGKDDPTCLKMNILNVLCRSRKILPL